MASTSGSKRSFTRMPVHIDAEVRSESGCVARGRVIDVSLTGVSLETEDSIPVGEECAIDLLLRGGGSPVVIRMRGHVARRPEGMLAFAVEVIDPSGYEHFMNLLLYNAPSARDFEAEVRDVTLRRPPVAPTGGSEEPVG